MRNLSCSGFKLDKKYLIAFIIALVCSIICGIVLYKCVNISVYFKEYSDNYIFFVFNFNNGGLLFPHFLSEIIYAYLIFLICYFTRFKYLSLIIVFIRGIFFAVYTTILFELSTFGGVTVAIFVFIPTTVTAFVFYFLIVETCKIINTKYVFFMPAVFAVINTLILLLFVNVIFRVIIVIV